MDGQHHLLDHPQGRKLLVMRRAARGFSLIELMVTIAVVAILLAIATPNFRDWMNNSRIRSASESIQNGLRVARNEAAQRGTWVRFELSSASVASWQVCQITSGTGACSDSDATAIENRGGTEALVKLTGSTTAASQTTTTTTLTGGIPGGITFDPLARPFATGTTPLKRIDVAGANDAGRRLVILISAGGMVRMCDPDATLAATNAQSCKSN